MATAIAVTAALLAACCFGVAAVLQQTAARAVPESRALRPSLLRELLRSPWWVLGIGLSAFSYVVQGAALAFGPLVLVQPLAATDLVFALTVAAWWTGTRLRAQEIAGVGCVTAGVAAFLVVLPPGGPSTSPAVREWLLMFLVVAGVVAVLLWCGLRCRGPLRAGLYAGAAGLLFGVLAALTKSAAELFRAEGIAALGHWQPYALIVVGGSGLLCAQSSFQAGSLAVSLPVIDIVEPLGGVLVGAAIFGERMAGSTGAVIVQVLGALLAALGIVLLDRSPLVRGTAEHG